VHEFVQVRGRGRPFVVVVFTRLVAASKLDRLGYECRCSVSDPVTTLVKCLFGRLQELER